MKTDQKILIAFILNLGFSIFEFFGGLITGSIAIISDAIHDIGDAASIGISYFLEKKSKRQPDEIYTYGYTRYSVVGSIITTFILLIGSLTVIHNAIGRILSPAPINYNGMILFAIIGVCVNITAAIFTRGGESLNQKAVNLHMLEDVLGWIAVLIGAIVIRFTDFVLIDPIVSICVAVYILKGAVVSAKTILDLFLMKAPQGIDLRQIREQLRKLDNVLDVHHIHIWSLDGTINCATLHIVTSADHMTIKESVRNALYEHGIKHVTIEFEQENENCLENNCVLETSDSSNQHQHHHQHHHHHHNHHH